jgi:hypothetical protein
MNPERIRELAAPRRAEGPLGPKRPVPLPGDVLRGTLLGREGAWVVRYPEG